MFYSYFLDVGIETVGSTKSGTYCSILNLLIRKGDNLETITLNKTPLFAYHYNQESNYKFEFALINNDGKLLTTPYMCKDYLTDLFWSEYTGKKGSQYGFNWEPGRIDMSDETFRLAVMGNTVDLESQIGNLTSFINAFEDAQGFKRSVIHKTTSKNDIVVEFSKEWTTCAPLVSTLTTLIRAGGMYIAGENIKTYLQKLKNMKTADMLDYMRKEVERFNITLPRMLAVLSGAKVEYDWNKLSVMGYAHACGIVGFSEFPGGDGKSHDEADPDDDEDDDDYYDEDDCDDED